MKTYFISDGTYVKIGKSNNPRRRLIQLQTANPLQLQLIMIVDGDHEAQYKGVFAQQRRRGEWFEWDAGCTRLMFFIVTGRGPEPNDDSLDLRVC